MKRISEPDRSAFRAEFQLVWIGGVAAAAVLSGFHWVPLCMLLVGVPWLWLISRTLKEVSVDAQALYIRQGEGYEKIPLDRIEGPVERSLLLAGSYRIYFGEETEFGRFVLFMPRKRSCVL